MSRHDEAVEVETMQLFAKQRLGKQWVLVDNQDRIMFQCWAKDTDGKDERLTKRLAALSTCWDGDKLVNRGLELKGLHDVPDASETAYGLAVLVTTLKAQVAAASDYASSLLDSLHPGLEHLDTIAGLLSQVDNVTVGLKQRAEAAEAGRDRLAETLNKIASWTQSDNLLWWQIDARAALSDNEPPAQTGGEG